MTITSKIVFACLIFFAGFSSTTKLALAFQEQANPAAENAYMQTTDSVQASTTAEQANIESISAAIKEELQTNINIVWTCVAAFLVFFMQAGFAMVEHSCPN